MPSLQWGLRKGNATLCRSHQSNTNIVSTLLLTCPTDRSIHLQQLQNSLRGSINAGENASSWRSLAESLVLGQLQHAGLSLNRDPKREFDCFSVTATSGEAPNSSQRTRVTFHLDALRLRHDFISGSEMDQAGRWKKLVILMRCKCFEAQECTVTACHFLSQTFLSH